MSNPYLQRHKFCELQIDERPSENLGIVIVIPCFYEPDLTTALSSLYNCDRPGCDVEVIVVVNSPEDSPGNVLEQNIRTIREANAWILKHIDKKLRFHILHFPELPKKHAGVGLARKIGMDEAVSRFSPPLTPPKGGRTGQHFTIPQSKRDGIVPAFFGGVGGRIIVNFDADCLCEKNYLKSIESHFKNNLKTPACSIYYEHPLDNLGSCCDLVGIIKYELFLRYYVIALRYSGYPYAYNTIGSCMAVRSDVYQQQGGMNRRQAGEDFYFLQKIIQLGNFTELTATTVYPSSRRSTRVPFGTGKAISGRMSASSGNSEDHLGSSGQGAGSCVKKNLRVGNAMRYTYNPKTFDDLKIFFSKIPLLYQIVHEEKRACKFLAKLPASISAFLKKNNFIEHLNEIQANTVSEKTFIKRFYRWFNGLKVLQFVHFARDNYYNNIPVEEAAITLLKLLNLNENEELKELKGIKEIKGIKGEKGMGVISAMDLLLCFRKIDKRLN